MMDKSYNTVRLPKFNVIIGIIGLIFFVGSMIISYIMEAALWITLCILFFVLLNIIIIVMSHNWRITYDDQFFSVRNYFGVSKNYSYNQITSIQSGLDTTIIVGEKKITIDQIAIGAGEFLCLAEKRYSDSFNDGLKHRIPEIPPKKDIFNGNIHNPVEFICVYVFMEILVTIGLVIAILNLDPSHSSNERLGFFIFIGSWLVWTAYVVMSIHVGRNIEKYSKKVVSLFFKESYVRWNNRSKID